MNDEFTLYGFSRSVKVVHMDERLINSKYKMWIEIIRHNKKVKHRFNWRARKSSLVAVICVYSLRIISESGIGGYSSKSYLTLLEAINSCDSIVKSYLTLLEAINSCNGIVDELS